MHVFRRVLYLVVPLAVNACGATPTGTSKPGPGPGGAVAEKPDGPLPGLRTGTLPMREVTTPFVGTVVHTTVDAGMETLEIGLDPGVVPNAETIVSVAGSTAFSFGSRDGERGVLWVRRPASAAGSPVVADVFVLAQYEEPGSHLHVRADDPKVPSHDATVLLAWEAAFRARLSNVSWTARGVWNTFAQARLGELIDATTLPPPPLLPPPLHGTAGKPRPPAVPARPVSAHAVPPPVRRPSTDQLAGLMSTTTGVLAAQEALQADRALFLAAASETPSVPIAQVAGPKLATHPWALMTKRLATAAPKEALAEAVPAEFYYVRAASFDAFTALLDQADAWGTPVAEVLDNDPVETGLSARYEAELGVKRGPLSRALGSKVISDLAVTGSDPYLREGSDVTLVFRVKDHTLFAAALGTAVSEHARAHGAIATSQLTLAGVAVSVARSADGTVRQHRAAIGELEFVSNSAGALARVLEAAQGKRARLADELDFKFMLARDARTSSQVLAYMGDRFVAEVIGPKQKIGEARRQLALGELLTPGFSALLYGEMFGKSPASAAELIAAHLLDARELTHVTGAAIAWQPGQAARSTWGTPGEMTPLIDLPAVELVTESERTSYDRFSRGYEQDWQTYIDPIAVRLSMAQVNGHTSLTAELRELPLIDGSGYNSIEKEAGSSRFEVAQLASGARAVLALGEDSWIRRTLQSSRGLFGERKLTFDWVGAFATIGVLDRSEVVAALLAGADDWHVPQLPRERTRERDAIKAISRLPLYAEIAVKNPVGAAATLTGLRAIVMESAPGLVTWGQSETYRDVPIVRISVDEKKAKREFDADVEVNIYYALTNGALVVSLDQGAIHKLIDARIDGKGAVPVHEGGSQLALDAASGKGGAIWTCLAWIAEGELEHHNGGTSRTIAEALLRGAPEHAADPAAMRALAFAYFGMAPITTDGGVFTLGPDGLVDPVHGSASAYKWTTLPVPGSPVEALMRVLSHARADLSFDEEGKDDTGKQMRSLHARVTTLVD